MSRGIRESQEERVLHAIFIVTLEDLRWLHRVELELPALQIQPKGIFQQVHGDLMRLIEEGQSLDPESQSILEAWMEVDRHWLSLFRERVSGRGYPLARQIQKRVSNRYFGGELYFLWQPEELLDKAERLAPFKWKIAREYTIPYEHDLWQVPTVSGRPVKVPECEWKQEEKDILYFFGSSDLETFLRMRQIPQISVSYPEKFWEMKDDLENMQKHDLQAFLVNLDKAKFFETCLRNDYSWWLILERELERVFAFTVSLRIFGRRVYNFNDLKKTVDKLYSCFVVPYEKYREFEMRAKMIGEQLIYPFHKWEAEEHGFTDVKEYLKWKEQQNRRENDFLGVYVGPGDQELIDDWVEAYYQAEKEEPGTWRGLDAVDSILVNYGYDFADKPHHRGYRLKPNGKWVYTSNMISNREEVFKEPYEDRSFSTNNYELDREIVVEVLKKRGFVFTKTGWQKLHAPLKTYKFIVRSLQPPDKEFEIKAIDATQALEILAKQLDTTPATLYSVVIAVYEDGKRIQ